MSKAKKSKKKKRRPHIKKEDKKRFYSQKEVSEMLRVSRSLLWKLRENGEIEFHKFGQKIFYSEEQIEDYLRRTKHRGVV